MFSKKFQKYDKTGFLRNFDLSHAYHNIDDDIDRLIQEGYLIELKGKDVVKKEIYEKEKRQGLGGCSKKEFETSILYPINMDADPNVEVRGSASVYPQDCLTVLSQLWNDP